MSQATPIPFPITGTPIPQTGSAPFNINSANLTLGAIINGILPYLFVGAGLLLLIYLIIGGIQLMLSQGDPKAVQSAQSKITGALIGFLIVFASFWIVQLVGSILGIQIFKNIFG